MPEGVRSKRGEAIISLLEELGRPATAAEINKKLPKEFREITHRSVLNACYHMARKGDLKTWGGRRGRRTTYRVFGLPSHEPPESLVTVKNQGTVIPPSEYPRGR